jgi:Fe-S-cluster containining protein
MPPRFPGRRDHKLVQIVDASLADATRRAGDWLACRPGCTQCCIGVFSINQLDAARLKQGFRKLKAIAPDRAAAVHQRAQDTISRLWASFPGDPVTGILGDAEQSRRRFENFANDEPCPALNPQTGLCELYDFRPMTCRVFGPPVRSEDGLGVCELCFQGATDEQIQSCELIPDPENLEARLLAELEKQSEVHGSTIIPFALGLLK